MTIPYGVGDQAEVFKYSLFLVFCNRAVAATVAAITLVVSTTTSVLCICQSAHRLLMLLINITCR